MAEDKATLSWQRRMAPFMMWFLIVVAVYFGVFTLAEYSQLEARLSKPRAVIEDMLREPAGAVLTYEQRFELDRARAAFALEQELVARRYEQANLMLSTSLWTRLMGFITGMILALVGAAFILGKLQEDTTEAAGKGTIAGQDWALSLRSASPGLVMCILGAIMMTVSISIQANISARDQAIYFGRVLGSASSQSTGAEPCELCDLVPTDKSKPK